MIGELLTVRAARPFGSVAVGHVEPHAGAHADTHLLLFEDVFVFTRETPRFGHSVCSTRPVVMVGTAVCASGVGRHGANGVDASFTASYTVL